MKTLSPDTDPRAEAVMIECLRRLTLAELPAAMAGDLVEALGEDFYADPDSIRRAVLAGTSFNLIHRSGFHLERWAAAVGIGDLLPRAFGEAGL